MGNTRCARVNPAGFHHGSPANPAGFRRDSRVFFAGYPRESRGIKYLQPNLAQNGHRGFSTSLIPNLMFIFRGNASKSRNFSGSRGFLDFLLLMFHIVDLSDTRKISNKCWLRIIFQIRKNDNDSFFRALGTSDAIFHIVFIYSGFFWAISWCFNFWKSFVMGHYDGLLFRELIRLYFPFRPKIPQVFLLAATQLSVIFF